MNRRDVLSKIMKTPIALSLFPLLKTNENQEMTFNNISEHESNFTFSLEPVKESDILFKVANEISRQHAYKYTDLIINGD